MNCTTKIERTSFPVLNDKKAGGKPTSVFPRFFILYPMTSEPQNAATFFYYTRTVSRLPRRNESPTVVRLSLPFLLFQQISMRPTPTAWRAILQFINVKSRYIRRIEYDRRFLLQIYFRPFLSDCSVRTVADNRGHFVRVDTKSVSFLH